MLAALIALHVAQAAVAPAVLRRAGPRGFAVLALAPLAALVALGAEASGAIDGSPLAERADWVSDLGLGLDLRLDALSLLFAVLITGVGALVFLYAGWYFAAQPGLGRLASTLALFAGAMLGVVVADNLFVLYVFWELTSLTSFFLIGWEYDNPRARAAANQALMVTVAGGLAMLAGFVVLGQDAGTFRLSELASNPPDGTAATAGLALVLVGAFTKSAQWPFHFWLPAAMEAPTPISAYLHSATMVKAGVYLVARLAPVGAEVELWTPAVVTVGLATMLVGGYLALRQHDIKLLLAYGTVSQLGFMMLLVGGDFGDAFFAGGAVILAHGLFKATLFLLVGIVDHHAHTRDMRRLPPLWGRLPLVVVCAALGAASMAGIPVLFGFVAKELAIEAWLHAPTGPGGAVVLAGVVAGSALTVAYTARFLWGGFLSPSHREHAGAQVDPAPWPFVMAPAVLATATLVFGLAPGVLEELVSSAATVMNVAAEPHHLKAWPALGTGLYLSGLAVAVGLALWAVREPVERIQRRVGIAPSASAVYDALVAGVIRVASRLTGVVQRGSLPVYLGVICVTAVAVPLAPLLSAARVPEDAVLAHSWPQALIAVLVVSTVTAAAIVRHRFAAVLLLGATGYGVAALFVVQGAPDLALTQVLVETVAVVMFVLVLRFLPPRFARPRRRVGQGGRLVVAAAVGLFVAAFSVVAAASRTTPSISDEYVARAVPEAHSRNVVNAILVDFRAFDTLGEVTVLTVAGLGIVSLVRAARRSSS